MGVVLGLLGFLALAVYDVYIWMTNNPNLAVKVLVTIEACIMIMYLTGKLVPWALQRHPAKVSDRRLSTGLAYVIVNFIKAKKNKVCPMVEFIE